MTIEDKINRFAELLTAITVKATFNQKRYAKELLEDVINHLHEIEIRNNNLQAKLSNLNHTEYLNNLDRCVDVLQCMGFDLIEVNKLNKEETDFIKLHRQSIGPVTKERLLNIIQLFRYFRQTNGHEPTSLKQLTESYNEIRESKK